MIFNTNEFLRAISRALDFVEMDLFGVASNHSKRIALIAVKIGQRMNMSEEESADIISLALLHDNGASLKILHERLSGNIKEKQNQLESMKEHCRIGEENVSEFQFRSNSLNVIIYHHENYDGTGFFGKKSDEIPLISQIIHLADKLDLEFDLKSISNNPSSTKSIVAYVKKYSGTYFSPEVVNVFKCLIELNSFWCELTDDAIDHALKMYIPDLSGEYNYREIRKITKTFSRIIDAKSAFTQLHSSGLAEKVEKMVTYYDFDKDTSEKLIIAADLHDLGKLAISNTILDKPETLTEIEFEEIKRHPVVSKDCLEGIKGFEQIVKWIYQHHEKLDGSGYPQGLTGETLDFQARLLTCLDIYQALIEDRPYREAMDHFSAMNVLHDMAIKKLIDQQIVNDINKIFTYVY